MLDDLRRDIPAVTRRKNLGSAELDRVVMSLQDNSQSFFSLFPGMDGRTAFGDRAGFLALHGDWYRDLMAALEITGIHLQMIRESMDEVIPLFGRARAIQDSLKLYME